MKKVYLSLILLTAALACGSAYAQDSQPRGTEGALLRPNKPNFLKELDLSREQIQKIRRLNQQRRPLMQAAQERLRNANLALDDAIYAENPVDADVQAKLKDVQAAHEEVVKLRITDEYAIRRVLTKEQLAKFLQLRAAFTKRLGEREDRSPR
jgi:Spy/CpxP family protein refolding chaperone